MFTFRWLLFRRPDMGGGFAVLDSPSACHGHHENPGGNILFERRTHRLAWLFAILVTFSLVAAACGDSGGSSSAPATTAAPTTTAGGGDTATTAPPATEPTSNTCAGTTASELSGQYPGQFELTEYEAAADCVMSFSENPDIGALASQITHITGDLPPVADRLPSEPLVIAPGEAIGTYGGVFNGLSRANEAGTSDLLSFRHVNLVRFAPDLVTILPNVAKAFEFNSDFTELTFTLREGTKWSNGEPFTSEDVRFWLEDLVENQEIAGDLRSNFKIGGKPLGIKVIDDLNFAFVFGAPTPGFLGTLATTFVQFFQPDEFLKQFHPDYNSSITSTDKILEMWSPSNWKDVGSPWLTGTGDVWTPTLEPFIVVDESTEERRLVANPYFYAVDTSGQQLPYINEMSELFIEDSQVTNLRITNGEVDYKTQALTIADFPVLKDNQDGGNYKVQLAPSAGTNVFYAFNLAIADPALNAAFNDVRFREAFSLSLNRDEINDLIFFGQGIPQQSTPADPNTVNFVTDDQLNAFINYDPEGAKALLDDMGLTPGNDGCRINVNLNFSDQGSPADMHELVRGYARDVGICLSVKQVSSDQYRESAARNEQEMLTWANDGTTGAFIVGVTDQLLPPFGEFFNPGPALHWQAAAGVDNGVDPVDPPADVAKLYDLVAQFQQQPLGSAESDRIGNEIVQIHVDNLWKIGTIGSVPAPTIFSNDLHNDPEFTVHTYDFYWAYPFNTYSWFLTRG